MHVNELRKMTEMVERIERYSREGKSLLEVPLENGKPLGQYTRPELRALIAKLYDGSDKINALSAHYQEIQQASERALKRRGLKKSIERNDSE